MEGQSDNIYNKKRKAPQPLTCDMDLQEYEERSQQPQKPEEFKRADEETMKQRKVVRVVRGSQDDSSQAPKGKFQFLSSDQHTKSAEGGKTSKGQTEELAKTSTDKQIIEKTNGEKPTEEINMLLDKFQKEKEEGKTFNFVSKSKSSDKKGEDKSHPKLLNANPFTAKPSAGDKSAAVDFKSFNQEKKFMFNTNPFKSYDKNKLSETRPTEKPVFFTQNSQQQKPSFSFNFSKANTNPNWEEKEEDEEGVENPEEEITIEEKNQKKVEVSYENPNSKRIVKVPIDELYVYNYSEKKYHSKGKGDLSIEISKNEESTKLYPIVVYRNNAYFTLFKAGYLTGVTSFETTNKNFKTIGLLQRLFKVNESTKKPEPQTIKFYFPSEQSYKHFKEKFDKMKTIVDQKDFSVFSSVQTNNK